MESKSIVIGITGGIGTGKSTVSKLIEDMGLKVLKSDDVAKELMVTNAQIKSELIEKFGNEVYFNDGKLNAKYLSSQVFDKSNPESEENLKYLNQTVHPHTIQWMMDSVEQFEIKGEKLIFVESALIYEADLDEGFDYIIVVDCPDEIRIKRVMERNGMTEQEVIDRINNQVSQQEKKGAADFVIDNSKDLNRLKENVDFLMNIFKALIH